MCNGEVESKMYGQAVLQSVILLYSNYLSLLLLRFIPAVCQFLYIKHDDDNDDSIICFTCFLFSVVYFVVCYHSIVK